MLQYDLIEFLYQIYRLMIQKSGWILEVTCSFILLADCLVEIL